MKETAFLINVSRGALVNELDLINALKNSEIRGAALDVFTEEPPKKELATLPNVIATPHIGGATFEAIQRTGKITLQNIERFLHKQSLKFEAKV